jgi:outer membrane protein TolC
VTADVQGVFLRSRLFFTVAFAYRKAVLRTFREVEDALAAISHLAREDEALARERDVLTHTLAIATKRGS